jgi:hypothetical protein
MPNWWDDLPTITRKNDLQDALAHRKDGGDAEPSAVGDDTNGATTPFRDVPELPAPHTVSMMRARKIVPGASESEVMQGREGMMQNLSGEHVQLYAKREEIRKGKAHMITLVDGKAVRVNQ